MGFLGPIVVVSLISGGFAAVFSLMVALFFIPIKCQSRTPIHSAASTRPLSRHTAAVLAGVRGIPLYQLHVTDVR